MGAIAQRADLWAAERGMGAVMRTEVEWHGVSAKFREVHANVIDKWLTAYDGNRGKPHINIWLYQPLGSVRWDMSAVVNELVTTVGLYVTERRDGRARILTVSPVRESIAVLADWDKKYDKTTVEEFKWYPDVSRLVNEVGVS